VEGTSLGQSAFGFCVCVVGPWGNISSEHYASKPLQVGLLLLFLKSSTSISAVAKAFYVTVYMHRDVCNGMLSGWAVVGVH
jgi:predicted MFS family arabinose efflux permease